jgi:hypothetical protein
MMTPSIAKQLARVSEALAAALEGDDLEAAERLATDRDRLLQALTSAAPAPMMPALRAALDADRRSQSALLRRVAAVRAELAELSAGTSAVRAYAPAEPLAPGFVDRRD